MGKPPETRQSVPHIAASGKCPTLQELATLTHYVIHLDPGCALVLARRTAERFTTVQQIEECFDRIELLLTRVERARFKLLVDVRNGPSRNDPEFEEAVRLHRPKLLCGFSRNVALAATAVGRLQIQRYASHDRRAVFVTDDVAAAFAHLGLPPHCS